MTAFNPESFEPMAAQPAPVAPPVPQTPAAPLAPPVPVAAQVPARPPMQAPAQMPPAPQGQPLAQHAPAVQRQPISQTPPRAPMHVPSASQTPSGPPMQAPVQARPAGQVPAAPQQAAPQSAPAAQQAAPQRQSPPTAGVPGKRVGSAQDAHADDLDVIHALRQMAAVGASDLHLTAGSPPVIRLDGKLTPLADYGKLNPESLQRSLYSLITQAQRERFEEKLELDFSRAIPGEARFRVNMYKQRDAVGAVFRLIPYEIKPLETLGIPEVVGRFADLPRGLVLVTGPTGSGKSTTLASLIDLANRQRASHIMTVEDPIEFLHTHKRSLVNQREVGADTHSFGNALRHVLRQDPDIILIGELRDLETIQVALTAAETGHLVFATLHTQDAAQTIDRMIDVFPGDQQGQIRTQLATAIQGVVCQTLLRRGDGPGRAVAVEVMMATPAIRNLIREGKTHQIYTALQAGSAQGMQSMDQHLAELVKSGKVPYDVAIEACHSPEEFNRLAGRFGN
ncbi:type IV pilus twitching motility protein PilT [Demequina aurantiaca]|uniref:type IV pilus twitching motility protein PilT n=1 Tax=Demequina aurantiaca TaxID=676200 RepID=UPI000ADDCFC8|nr:type IV pilus twitching motility protein PilT [Demequina aurantiaca]